jgi:hypothetical protein
LSIEVTLLLQSNSEEIERISFVQHYERKAVESKATIQPLTTEAIANYVGREYSKEMRLLLKNHHKENEPKEPVMPSKEEAKSPFMMKK